MKFETLLLLLMLSVHSGNGAHRRILHQPLFPASSYPPPTPTPPLPPDYSDGDNSDQPFFPEDPYGETRNQTPPPPPPMIYGPMPISSTTTTTTTTTAAAHPTKPTKSAAIAISIGIVTLGFLSALLFFVYRKKAKNRVEEQKPEGVMNPNSQSNGDGTRAPPSNFLYIGTLEPHNQRSENFSSVRKQRLYRPSPDLMPLPPLIRPPGNATSTSSEDEGLDEIKHAIIPSIKKTPPPQEAPRMQPLHPEKKNGSVFELKSSLSRRAKFGPPPPPPNLALLQSISNQTHYTPKVSATTSQPLPPLPPPPPLPAQPVNVPPRLRSTWTNFIKRPSEFQSLTPPTLEDGLREDVDSGGRTSDRPKLKPLHWDKVRAASDRATVWDQMEPSSFPLNEDMMESLFGCNSNKLVKNETTKKSVLPPVEKKENRVLDPKRSQNIAILLRALTVTRDEVSEALLDGNSEALGSDLLETLAKMAPTKEEEIKLTGYKGDTSKLGSAEKFLKTVLDIPFAFKRVEAMLYRANFDTEAKYLRKSFQTLEEASNELKNSRLFIKLLEAVLTTGNRMNVGTNRGGAKSFKLDTLLKLVDIKATDGKTTLLHFVVQELIRSEGIASETGGLSREIGKVKLAAGMDSDVLHSNVTKLETGLQKVRTVLQCETSDMKGKFFESMKAFFGKAEEEICGIKEKERKALTLVREVTEYFHGDVGKEEAHPFRIFMIVRDFLITLDYVCKDVGTMQDKSVMGTTRSFHISSNVPLPVLKRHNVRRDDSSSEESSSP